MASHSSRNKNKAVNPVGRRSFGGCTACRKRRLKCDEARPECAACAISGVTCTYEISLFFGFDDHLDSVEGRYRRPVLSEKERQLMSEWLTSTIAPDVALQHITQIDNECAAADLSDDIQIEDGPFGAFRVTQSTHASSGYSLQSSSVEDFPLQTEDQTEDLVLFDDCPLSPNTQEMIALMFDQPNFDLQTSETDLLYNIPAGSRVHEVFDDISLTQIAQPAVIATAQSSFDISPRIFSPLPTRTSTPSRFPTVNPADNAVTQEALSLLKHYQSTILPLLTPFRHSKTPWHVLFIPQVKNCLAALTLGEQVDDATLCAFYGTLSISALSLGGISESSKWTELAKDYKKLARKHVRRTLESAYHIPKKAKYKSILIALLTMVQLSIISGNPEQTECYLLQAEKFIRLRGLQRRKSRKVRLLHHCYAFERILFESTRINGVTQGCRGSGPAANEASGLDIVYEYALPFRLSYWTDLEQEMLRVKSQEEGENDLHLQLPGDWSATLYPEIFGVPEQWILLVSLIIQLAKEKENEDSVLGLSVKGFLDRAKAIESLINKLQQPVADVELGNLLEAMQNALAIYFYRRIYDVEAAVLQAKVARVKNCLLRAEREQLVPETGAARFIWPAFVAACEAEDKEVQLSFSCWFRDSAERSGLRLFATTLASIERVWEAKMRGLPTNPHGTFMNANLSMEDYV